MLFSTRSHRLILGCFILVVGLSLPLLSQVQIGSSTYTTLKAAFDAINAGTHTGAITVLITNNTSETAQAILYGSGTGGANYSSVSIRPSGVTGTSKYTISGTLTIPLVEFNGASNVTLDGCGTTGGTDRNLAVVNSGTYASDYLAAGGVHAINCSNINIKNIITYKANTDYSWGIKFDGTRSSTIENCWAYKSNYGIWVYNRCSNITVKNNLIGSTTSSDKIRFIGLRFTAASATGSNNGDYSCDGFSIIGNEVIGIDNTALPTDANPVNVVRGFLIGDAINGTIYKNIIHNVHNSANNTGSGAYAVQISGYNGAQKNLNITFANNFIYDVVSSYSYVMGMLVHSQSNSRYYHNTISTGTTTAYSFSAAIYVHQDNSSLTIKNNIFKNDEPVSGGGTAYGIYMVPTTNVFTSIDYNNYSVASSGTNAIAYYNGAKTTLSDWQTAINDDKNSQNIDPTFISSTNLHLDGSSASNSSLKAPYIATDTYWNGVDIDNEARVTGTGNVTFRGADEVIPTLSLTRDINQYSSPLCQGSSFSYSISASVRFGDGITRNVSPTYEWYKLPSSVPISGATGSIYSKSQCVAADGGTYYAKASYTTLSVQSSYSNLTVHTPASITQQPTTFTYVCEGFPFDYPPYVITQGTVTGYQWQKENNVTKVWENIPGQTDYILNIIIQDAALAQGNYRVIVYGGVCNSGPIYSSTTTVAVSEPLSNVYISYPDGFQPGLVCSGDPIHLTAEASGTIVGYQWERLEGGAFRPIPGNQTATQKTFVIDMASDKANGTYRCKVFGSANCLTGEVNTKPVDVKVWNKFKIAVQPEPQILCQGGDVRIEVVPDGVVLRYQWQKEGVNIDPKANPSADDPIFMIDKASYSESGVYRCVMTVSDCRGIVDDPSDDVLVYIMTDPLITREPQSAIASLGETAMFEVQAHSYDQGAPVEKYSYQWYRGTLNDPLVNNATVAGADASILIIRDVKATDYGTDYFCVVNGLCGTVQTQNCGIMLPPDVKITGQTVELWECESTDVEYFVQAQIIGGGQTLSYQWMKDGVDLIDGGRISGATTDILKIAQIIKSDEGNYSAKVTVHPGENTASSIEAPLHVKEKPVITTQPVSTLTVQAGRELSLTVVATGTDPLGYQWYFEENSIPGEINATITIPAATTADAGTYYCVVSNECGVIESDESEVTVNNQNQTSVSEVSSNGYTLFASVPNPVSDRSVISFVAPEAAQARLTLTDALGNDVAVLFDGITNNGRNDVKLDLGKLNLSSGVYYYTLTSQSFRGTMKMIINR